jgi:hypothetical protein
MEEITRNKSKATTTIMSTMWSDASIFNEFGWLKDVLLVASASAELVAWYLCELVKIDLSVYFT